MSTTTCNHDAQTWKNIPSVHKHKHSGIPVLTTVINYHQLDLSWNRTIAKHEPCTCADVELDSFPIDVTILSVHAFQFLNN